MKNLIKTILGVVVAIIVLASCTQGAYCATYAKTTHGSHLDRTKCIDY